MIKPQDVVVALKLLPLAEGEARLTYAELARQVGLSGSETHGAVARGLESGLLRPRLDGGMPRAVKQAMREFLVYGVPYIWPAKRGGTSRGTVTATSHPEVARAMRVPEPDLPLVWANPDGDVRGETVPPLYAKAVAVARFDPALHEWLALIDVLRLKSGREAALARAQIERRLL